MLRPILSPREQVEINQRIRSSIGEELQRRYEPPQALPELLAHLVHRLAEREKRPPFEPEAAE